MESSRSSGIGGERRIGEQAVAIVIGQLLGLDQQVQEVGAQELAPVQLERLEDVEHLQHGEALRRRRRVVDLDVPVAALQGRAPVRLLGLEVGGVEEAALPRGEVGERRGDRPS